MFLSNLSIKHPVFATMMMVALAVVGVASSSQLKVDFVPKVAIPKVTVAGTSPVQPNVIPIEPVPLVTEPDPNEALMLDETQQFIPDYEPDDDMTGTS